MKDFREKYKAIEYKFYNNHVISVPSKYNQNMRTEAKTQYMLFYMYTVYPDKIFE